MFKKHKQLVVGFLLGVLIFGVVPVSATVQEYILQRSQAKIIVDGKEFSNAELPVLNYKGYNYIPASTFREICDKIEVGFKWVGDKNEIQINTEKNISKVPTPLEERKGEGMTTIEKDGFILLTNNQIQYITLRDIYEKYNGSYNFNPTEDSSANNRKMELINTATNEILLTIPHEETHIFNNQTHLTYEYYLNNVLPLIRK